MILESIFAGFGGQGVLLLGQILAYAGMYESKYTTWFPAYGAEVRGGTANCSVVISDEPIGSPVISEPEILVVMNRPSLERFEGMVKPGGTLFYNSSIIDVKPKRTDITVMAIPASDIAAEAGNPRAANMVVLGAILKSTGIVNIDTVTKVLEDKVFTGKKKDLVAVNRVALEKGMAFVS